MMPELLWIVGAYALGAAAVQAAYRFVRSPEAKSESSKHYILYALNDDRHIERAVRMLSLFHYLQGRPFSLTIIDEGSTDRTLDIARILARRYELCLRSSAAAGEADASLTLSSISDSHFVHIRLSRPDDWLMLPRSHYTII